MILISLLAIVLLALAVAGFTVLNARRKASASGEADSDSQSFVGGVLSALFTVVLAFYIVFAWQNGDDIDKASQQETNALIDVYWQSSVAPQQQASAIQSTITQYTARVADQEWLAHDAGEADPEAEQLLAELRSQVLALPADSEALKTSREQSLQDIRQITEHRQQRVTIATDDQSFNVVLLVASILGAVLMIAFPLLIGLSMRPANVAVMALLAVTLGFTVYMSFELLHPFSGPFGVDPDSFNAAQETFQTASRPTS
ncbi:DUF4239 domain-containing protein [Saccharopolyspora sp. WRP15-2]|uniref:DUF4239 domain-containing protein n=1 Tax=Saccharopolyspora oryzae TaxID=2997343 RepID=A0ABT4USC1_9PSEU|nr:DUF4239 domain-containing protein [Saccharopolyspora oryzae]MDA3624613.1 DUF4239 domain-containing protein [Saccharopolyspora oryzae]